MIVAAIRDKAIFNSEKMGKASLAQGEFVYAGLNAFEPGQEHAAHVHEGQDKLYYVVDGVGEVTVGDQTRSFSAGDLALAPAGTPHALRNPGPGRLVVLVVFGPPPRKS